MSLETTWPRALVSASPPLCGPELGQRQQPSRHPRGSLWLPKGKGCLACGLPWVCLSRRCHEAACCLPAEQSCQRDRPKGQVPTAGSYPQTHPRLNFHPSFLTTRVCTRVCVHVCVTLARQPPESRTQSCSWTHGEEQESKTVPGFPLRQRFLSMPVHVVSFFVLLCDMRGNLETKQCSDKTDALNGPVRIACKVTPMHTHVCVHMCVTGRDGESVWASSSKLLFLLLKVRLRRILIGKERLVLGHLIKGTFSQWVAYVFQTVCRESLSKRQVAFFFFF